MRRAILEDLKKWKNKKNRKPLLITGVRQCGKTYILKEFANECFTENAYFNFEEIPSLKSIFEPDLSPKRIIEDLSNVFLEKKITPGKTLVIFDEVQACPNAITSLKYFCESMRELHIVCAGSLLGVSLNRDGLSFPVGKVDRLKMYPMSFAEFMLADGLESMMKGVSDAPHDQPIADAYVEKLERAYKHYLIVGGMPEAVSTWCSGHDVYEVEEIQNNILEDYSSDFAKHAPTVDIPKLGWIWDSIPVQLAKENNKFIFSHVKAGKRSKELEDALKWLVDAGLVYKHNLVKSPSLPLSAQADNTYFKLYMADVGLMRKKSGLPAAAIMNDSEIYRNYKGAITENYVCCELKYLGIDSYFWRSGNSAELDFLFEHDTEAIPVEVKSNVSVQAKSYQQFCKVYSPKTGFRISMKNMGVSTMHGTYTHSMPLYMIWNIRKYI